MSDAAQHEGIFPPDYWRPRHCIDANGKPCMDPPWSLYERRAYMEGIKIGLGALQVALEEFGRR